MHGIGALAALALSASIAGGGGTGEAAVRPDPDGPPPHVNHVFVVVIENESASSSFGPDSPIPYLAETLKDEGAFIPDYYAIAHNSLPNYVAMIGGQAPNPKTQTGCSTYTNFTPGTPASDGQVLGSGCVYPAAVPTVANQLEGAGLTWRGYMQDMANSVGLGAPASCRHPAIGAADDTQVAESTDQYAARHNPFVYYHSIIDLPTCQANNVDLNLLGADLQSESTTPSYSMIVPDLCNDGHDMPCPDGGPGGMEQANNFLQTLVPQIMSSPAYRNRGLLLITFDEAEPNDSTACCSEPTGPNTNNPGNTTPGPGGGRVGAVALSPCIVPGTVTDQDYNHYSLLRTVEDNFGLAHLGYAGQSGLRPFRQDVLNKLDCGETEPAPAVGAAMADPPPPAWTCKRKPLRTKTKAARKRCKKKAY